MTSIQRIAFPDVANRIRQFWHPHMYNPHIGFLAPTRSGKSFLIRWGILPIATGARVVLFDVKAGGEKTWESWGNDVTEIKPGFAHGKDGSMNYRLLIKPGTAGKTQIERALNIILAEGECIMIMDDSRKITARKPNLGFSGTVDEILTDGAGIGITAILAANSSVGATSSLQDQCGAYFLGRMANREQAKDFVDMAGVDRRYIPLLINDLKRREFLYTDQHSDDRVMCITGLPES